MTNKLKPNFTQIPNYILDDLWPKISSAKKDILMVICRQTYGWHKEKDKLSVSQLMEKTGLKKTCIIKNTNELAEDGIINKHKKHRTSIPEYSLKIDTSSLNGLASSQNELELVHETDPQKKVFKETITKDPDVLLIIKLWNKTTNQDIKPNKTLCNNIKATINQYTIDRLERSIIALSKDPWTINNNAMSINRLVKSDKRNTNINKFAPKLKVIKTNKQQNDDEKREAELLKNML